MRYTELLNKIQTNLENTASNITIGTKVSQSQTNNVETILNKIGLEVQRQGGN